MAHRQHPIGTGFTAASTADDVVAGIDLTGTNIVVTGGHSGLGLETTRVLANAGASVTVASRNPERASPALAGIGRVEVSRLDLLDPTSIDAFAARYRNSGRPLHILINSAGHPVPDGLVRDARGYEPQFATNHLGHFQLTLGLLPALRTARGARVVNVTSGAQRFSDIRWDDPHFATGYDPILAYAHSKTATVLFAVELDRRWAEDGIRGYAVHPGVVVGKVDHAREVITNLSAGDAHGGRPRRLAVARLDLALALIRRGEIDEAVGSALAAVTSGRVAPSNRWRALEVVRAAEAAGAAAAGPLREAYRELERTS